MSISRRHFLYFGAGAAAMGSLGIRPLTSLAKAGKKIPIGLQLYSVRGECAKDLPAVLEAVGNMGYAGVEFAGYYGRTAKEMRKMLDDNGLACCGTHTALGTLSDELFTKTVEYNKTLGNKFLIVPGMPAPMRNTIEATKKTAELFNKFAEKAKPLGMCVGYHAHGGDFKKLDGGQTSWDVLFSNTTDDVVMQMDTGNCIGGGGDPIAILKKFPGRSATIHLKEHGGKTGAPVGEGDVPWAEIFEVCETTGGTQWYIVEHESPTASPLEAVKACLVNLRKMGK